MEQTSGAERSVNLVRRDVVKVDLALARGAHHFQQLVGAYDVCLHEGAWANDAAIHVALCRKVHDGIHRVLSAGARDGFGIPDVGLHERIARALGSFRHVVWIGCVGQQIQIHESTIEAWLTEQVANESRADEAAAASNEHTLGLSER